MGFAEAGFSALANNRRLQDHIRTKYFRARSVARPGKGKRWKYDYFGLRSMRSTLFWQNLKREVFSKTTIYTLVIVIVFFQLVYWLFW